jgi:ribosome-associated translation inhibitor RaiA
MENQIIFRYVACSKEDFANEISFDESIFETKLAEAFKLHIQIDRIEVTFHHDTSIPESPFICTVDVVAPDVKDNKVTEKGREMASATRKAIDTTMQLLRKHKDKHTH